MGLQHQSDDYAAKDDTHHYHEDGQRATAELELGVMNEENEGMSDVLASAGLLREETIVKRGLGRRQMLLRIFNYPEAGHTLRSTAWLDGLRGLAAFEVFLFHYCDYWPLDKTGVWGPVEDGYKSGFVYMPMIRSLIFSGDTAVCMFFAISGYVLSQKVLLLIHDRRQEKVLPAISSALFRRGIRLYLPVLVQSFILMLLVRVFDFPKPAVYESAATFWLEIRQWFLCFVRLLMPLRFPAAWDQIVNRYDGGISWTIPLEYYGSLQIYLALLVLAYVRESTMRRLLISSWVVISAMRDDWIAGQFLLGMAFSDYQIGSQRSPAKPWSRWQKWRPVFLVALFIFGFYASGMPTAQFLRQERGNNLIKSRPGFNWMTLPPFIRDWYLDFQVDRMIRCVAAFVCMVAIGESPPLRRCIEWRFVQYLGRISFGLYMCHIWVRPCLTPFAVLACRLAGVDPETRAGVFLPLAWILYMIPSATINFIVAGVFERYLDRTSVEAGKRMERLVLSFG